MEPLALLLMVLGLCCMAGMELTRSWLLKTKKALTPSELLISQNGIAIFFLLFATLWWTPGAAQQSNHKVFWIALLGTTLAGIIIHYANAKSQSLADLSLVKPIQAMTPGLVTLLALTVNEYPSAQGIAGIALISLGVYIHSRQNVTRLKEYLQPFTFLKLPANYSSLGQSEQTEARSNRLALRLAYIAAATGTFGLLFDSLVSRNGNVVLGFTYYSIFLTIAYSISAIFTKNNSLPEPFLLRIKKFWPHTLLQGVFWSLHLIFIMTAFRLAPSCLYWHSQEAKYLTYCTSVLSNPRRTEGSKKNLARDYYDYWCHPLSP